MAKWNKCTIDMVDDLTHEIIYDDVQSQSIKFDPCCVESWHYRDVEEKFCALCGRYVKKEKN